MAENNTDPVTFFAPAGKPTAVFNVRADLPPDEAFELASSFLSGTIAMATGLASCVDREEVWSLLYQIEMAKAVLDAGIIGLFARTEHEAVPAEVCADALRTPDPERRPDDPR